MAYVDPSFKTKKALKEAVAQGEEVTVFSPGPFGVAQNGQVAVEGPNYQMHTWYAQVTVENGRVLKVK
jgi:hypothetical protein